MGRTGDNPGTQEPSHAEGGQKVGILTVGRFHTVKISDARVVGEEGIRYIRLSLANRKGDIVSLPIALPQLWFELLRIVEVDKASFPFSISTKDLQLLVGKRLQVKVRNEYHAHHIYQAIYKMRKARKK